MGGEIIEENLGSQTRSRKRKSAHNGRSNMAEHLGNMVVEVARTFLRDLADFKFAAWLTLFTAYIAIVVPGVFCFMFLSVFPWCYVNAMAYIGVTGIPFWIGIYRKVKDEQNHARLMMEGWESTKSTRELVDEWKKMTEQKRC